MTCRLSLDVAKRVRRLDLKDHWPEIPKGGDVSDWASVGGEHTPERLKELIAAAPDYVPAAAASDDKSANAADDDAELEKLARMAPFDYERARMAAAKASSASWSSGRWQPPIARPAASSASSKAFGLVC